MMPTVDRGRRKWVGSMTPGFRFNQVYDTFLKPMVQSIENWCGNGSVGRGDVGAQVRNLVRLDELIERRHAAAAAKRKADLAERLRTEGARAHVAQTEEMLAQRSVVSLYGNRESGRAYQRRRLTDYFET